MILLVGGMGFIGLNTALRFLEVGQTVVITQHTSHRVPDVLKGEIGTRVLTTRMDVSNPYEVFEVVRRHQIESIVNDAAGLVWQRARRGDGDDALALDIDVPGAHALGCHDLSTADHEIEHGVVSLAFKRRRAGGP